MAKNPHGPNLEETRYGFNWGSLKIERTAHDDKKGWVIVSLFTPKGQWQLYATRGGKIRLMERDGAEWIRPAQRKTKPKEAR